MTALPPAVAALAGQLAEWEHEHYTWRTGRTVNLNAATNVLSPRARAALSSSSADKGISAGRHTRHHMGGRYIDLIEEAIEGVALELFGASAADLRPPTGSLANAITLAALSVRDRPIMTMDAAALGHFSYRAEGWSGRIAGSVVPMPMTPSGMSFDLERLEAEARLHRPSMLVVGSQAMLFPLEVRGLRRIADEIGAVVLYDAAHPLGLIAGGQFQDPLAEGAHIVAASTQKTMPGPVGGIILTSDTDVMKPIYDATDQLMSNYQNNRVLATGYVLLEMSAFGREYAAMCIENARALAGYLADADLPPLFADRGYTQSNQLLLSWGDKPTADRFAARCEAAGVIVSTVRLPSGRPGDEARFGTRLGTQDVTRQGVTSEELQVLAETLAQVAAGAEPTQFASRTASIATGFRAVYYDLDSGLPPV